MDKNPHTGTLTDVNPLRSLLKAGQKKKNRDLDAIVTRVGNLEDTYQVLTDDELRACTIDLTNRLHDHETLDDILPDAFAVVREAAHRVLNQRPYDVQIKAGAALARGDIAQMRTGEGKTLAAALPAYLFALAGKGVHVVTVNDYLATRDAEHIGRIHTYLGLTVAVITSSTSTEERAAAYRSDITYVTNSELGFDYLRDNMAPNLDAQVQRGHHYAIIDEIDSILIDEARTPLIISGPATSDTTWYPVFAQLTHKLHENQHYTIDRKRRTVSLEENAAAVVEDQLGIDNLYAAENLSLVGYLNNAIKAKELFVKDRDYVLTPDGQCAIIDEHTGRALPGRRYNDGLHQAIEAKENLTINQENQTIASVTLQNYFRLYEHLCGMTGTAESQAAEFSDTYNLHVTVIDTHKPMIRIDHPDRIYRTKEAKIAALVADVKARHDKGQPVLVGTASVASSEHIADALAKEGIHAHVLNAKNHEKEASLIAQAGQYGRVTVATNMAGRGTDIMLGGNPEQIAYDAVHARGINPLENSDEYAHAYQQELAAATEHIARNREQVLRAGGLAVLGSERHESRRIDDQLRGRAGRQGDPGESQFYLSLQDDLLTRFKAESVDRILEKIGMETGEALEASFVTGVVAKAQSHVENYHQHSRKELLKYDDVTNKQRLAIYRERQALLDGANPDDAVDAFTEHTLTQLVTEHCAGWSESWNLNGLHSAVTQLFPTSISIEQLREIADSENPDDIAAAFGADARAQREHYRSELGGDTYDACVSAACRETLDAQWRSHLLQMDYLRSGIGMRAIAQQDPIIEYTREANNLFTDMSGRIKHRTVTRVHQLCADTLRAREEAAAQRAAAREQLREHTRASQPDATSGTDTDAPASEHDQRAAARAAARARLRAGDTRR